MKPIICLFWGHKWKYSVKNSIVNGAQKDCERCGESVFRNLDLPEPTPIKIKKNYTPTVIKMFLLLTSPLWGIPLIIVIGIVWITKRLWRIISEEVDSFM